MKPTKILVTGATGFIGSRLCEMLSLAHKLPYRALVRDFSRAARIARLETELVGGDMLDAGSLAKAVEGCDVVVNLAHGDDAAAETQTTRLVEVCARAKVKRFVHMSSMAVYGPSPKTTTVTEGTTPIEKWNEAYSDAKAAAEAVVRAASKRGTLSTVILRPTIVYGPFSFFVTPIVADARAGKISLIDGGRGICNAVYVDDVCESVVAGIFRDDAVGSVVQINGDTRITWRDFITTFADMVAGEKTVYDHSLDEIRAHWEAQKPRARDSITAVMRLAGSPAFHAQLGTIPPVGKLIRGAKEMLSRRITPEHKMMLKTKLQGRTNPAAVPEPRPVKMPSEGRVVREAYPAWVTNDLAKSQLGWKPAHPFALGAQRTRDWLKFARLI